MNYLAIVELSLFACFTIFLGYCTIKLGKSAIGLIRTCEKLNEESDKMCKDIEPFLDFLTKAKIAMEEIENDKHEKCDACDKLFNPNNRS